jgi:heat shock protein HtpX
MVVATLLKGYFIAFLRVINLISRKQEYRADELACMVAGRQNLIEGLQAIHRAAVAWNFYWNNEVAPPLNDGCLVAVGDGFQRFIAVPEVSSAISKDLSKRLQEEKTQPYDTHPPLRDRIAAAEKLSEGSAPQDAQPASTLLQNLAATELKFAETCIPNTRPGSLQYVGWEDVVSRVRIPAWQKFVNEYSEPLQGVTAESVPDHMDKFREIGSRIRDPKGMLLSPPQRTARAGGLFASALALAMIRAGWELQVAPAVFRIHRGDQEFNPFDTINQLMAGKISPADWVARCREFGISELILLSKPGSDQPADPQQAELFEAPKT